MITGSTSIETLDAKFPTLTDKYKLVKTSDLIDKLKSKGFTLDKFVANKTRKKEREGYQKHRAIFSHSELLKSKHKDGYIQLLLTNSHDGSSSVVLQLGFFRMVCANGLVAGKYIGEPIRLKHVGKNLYDELDKAVEQIAAQVEKLDESIEKLKSVKLSTAEIKKFEEEALSLRTQPDEKVLSFNYPIHRQEDAETDLFTVMNVIQEGLIRGGVKVVSERGGVTRNKTLRGVSNLNVQTEINASLWNKAMNRVA